jgi:hypothetical protein
MTMLPDTFIINREIDNGIHKLTNVFKGLQYSPAFLKQFKTDKEVSRFLENANVRVTDSGWYMYVDPSDGYVVVNRKYLLEGEPSDLYLDIIHELVHVRQWLEGKDLFDRHYEYGERPTELEAYAVVVKEAKRIGMPGKDIIEYLHVPWISKEELQSMVKRLGVEEQQ